MTRWILSISGNAPLEVYRMAGKCAPKGSDKKKDEKKKK
jgi:hypothetical protein